MNSATGGNIIFHFKGDTSNLNKSVSSVSSGIKGMTKSILVATGITKALSAGMNLISSSTGAAVERLDQLNAFPKVMKSLGVSTKDSEKAVKRLSEKLKGLPTTLNQGTTAVSRFVSKNGDVKKSTDMFLALNNAIIAGNAPMENQRAALEQMTQAYSKGKPDLMEWRSLMTAMPGQLKQVAKAMGKVNTDDLYEALKTGEISMDDFMNKIVELNEKGGEGFESFEKQARNATGGIQTAMTNMRTAVSRGVANVIDSIDKGLKKGGIENGVAGVVSKIGTTFETGLNKVGKDLEPIISGLLTGKLTPGEVSRDLVSKLGAGLTQGLEIIKQQIPNVVPKAIDFIAGMMAGLGDALPTMLPKLAEVSDAIITELTKEENILRFIEGGVELGKGLIQGIFNTLKDPKNWLTLLKITNLPATIGIAIGKALIKGAIDGINNLKEKIPEKVKNIIKSIPQVLLSLNPATLLFKIGKAIIQGLIDGIKSLFTKPKENIKEAGTNVKTAIPSPITLLKNVGKSLMQGLLNGITGMASKPKQKISSLKSGIKGAISNPTGLLSNAGKNIMQGLLNGLNAKAGAVINRAWGIASSVASTISRALKIHSPSRITMWQGEMTGEGFMVGLEKTKEQLKNAVLDTFSLSPQLTNSSALHYSPNVIVQNSVNMETDPLGQTVSKIKTFAGGAKNDYNYGVGV